MMDAPTHTARRGLLTARPSKPEPPIRDANPILALKDRFASLRNGLQRLYLHKDECVLCVPVCACERGRVGA